MSGYIENHIIELVREQTDIAQIISDYVRLKKSGANYKGLCPFHGEKTPSFVVSPEKQIYHCFGCGEGGNVFSFIMKWENLTFMEAVKYLAEKQGINISFTDSSPTQRERAETQEQLYYINLAAAKYFHRLLTELPQGRPAREYLQKRGVSEKTVSKFLLGFAPFAWDQLLRHLQSQSFSPEMAAAAGLVRARETGTGYYDTFRSRIIFPIQNVRGKIIAFGGRTLNENEPESPKYVNSPESPIYEKGANLYGLNFAYEQIRKQRDAILVEGYMDLITAHQAGIGNVVATLGTALTRRQVKLLKRFTNQVTLVFDADAAGRAAAERGHGFFLEEGIKVRAASLPSGSDPDSLIREHSEEAFLKELNRAQALMEFIIERAAEEHDLSSIQGKVDCINKVIPFLVRIGNSVERNECVRLLSERASVREEDVQAELRRFYYSGHGGVTRKGARSGPKVSEPIKDKDRYAAAEEQLLLIVVHQKEVLESYTGRLSPALFKKEEHRQIVEALLKLSSHERSINVSRLIDMLQNPGAKAIASQIMMKDVNLEDWQGATEPLLKQLEERAAEPGTSTKERLEKATIDLMETEKRGEDIGPLMKKVQELRTRLNSEGDQRRLIRTQH